MLLDPATHHLAIHMRIGFVNDKHEIELAEDIGPVEPWWLWSLGVNLVQTDDANNMNSPTTPASRSFSKNRLRGSPVQWRK